VPAPRVEAHLLSPQPFAPTPVLTWTAQGPAGQANSPVANRRAKAGFRLRALKEGQGEAAALLRLLCGFWLEASS